MDSPGSMNSPYFESSIVGSPESLSSQLPSRPPRSGSGPTLGSHSMATSRRRASTDQRMSSGMMDLQIGTPKPTHQWTLFGQLMENEGQLPSPRPHHRSTTTGRPSSFRRNEHEESFTSGLVSSPARRSKADPFLDVRSIVEENEPAELSDDTARLPGRNPSAEDDSNYDSDSDSDTSDGPPSPISPEASERKWTGLWNHIPTVPILYRNVLKCSVAYFIASLFTFSPHLSNLISDLTSYGPGPHSPFPIGHMVATM